MNADSFKRVGVDIHGTASHSVRKGSSTYAASGCTVAPSMASICNRAGWKMGGTRDKYIKFENAGDQHLGRVLSGLNPLSIDFSLTPPFFDVENEMEMVEIDRFLRSRIENSENISDKTFTLVRYCFASLCFHCEFLKSVLEPSSRIRTSPLFINVPADIIAKAKAINYKDAIGHKCAPRLTGIPPHIVILNNLSGLTDRLDECSEEVVTKIKEDLDQKMMGGRDKNQALMILDKCKGYIMR